VAWGAGIGTVAIIGIGIWTGFGDMVHNMVLYHAQKTPMSPAKLATMRNNVLFHNAPIIILFVLSCFAGLGALARSFDGVDKKSPPFTRLFAAARKKEVSTVLFSIGMALFFLMVLLNMNRVWMYYFIPSFPFAAVGGGWLVSLWVLGTKELISAKRQHRKFGFSKNAVLGAGALLVIFALAWFLSPALETNLKYYEKEMKKPPEDRIHTYDWHPGLLPEGVNGLVRSTLWRDERVIGEPHSSFNYYLWHESRVFDIMDKIVEKIEEKTTEEGEIFGDSGTVPLFALLSKRRIAANEVDTNIQRYRSGNANPRELIEQIDTPKTEMIILRNRFGVALVPEVRRLVKEKYDRILSIRSKTGSVFHLYLRKS
jgi:hypothetical protein